MPSPARNNEHSTDLARVLAPECVLARTPVTSKKRALELASDTLASRYEDIEAAELFEALLARERLGTTALGEGVALPHCRLAGCTRPVGLLMTLTVPVAFQASDGEPVDVLFVLVVPEEATDRHLELLSMLAGALSDPQYRQRVRSAADADTLYEAAMNLPARS